MRVVVFVRASKNSEAGVVPSSDLLERMRRYNEELTRAGIVLAAEALQPSAHGKHIILSSGASTLVDGASVGMKSLIAGYWLWQVRSIEEAVEWARRCPAPASGEERELEIRPVFEGA